MKSKVGRTALDIVRCYHPEVTEVIDAEQNVEVFVTVADCRNGKNKKPDGCAMAKALMREYDGAIISLQTAYLVKGTTAVRYRVPVSVSRELVAFDRHKRFSPGTYHLSGVPKTARLGQAHSRRPKHNSGGKGKIKTRVHHTSGVRSLA